MKILQINTVCGIGSTGKIAADIHKMLIEQGHESIIAYGRGTAHNCDSTIKIGNNLDFYKHALKTRMLDKHGFGSKKATRKLIERVKNYNPDVIQLHGLTGYYINIEILFNFLKEYNKPIVWTLHACWAFTGHCSHFDYANCYKWETHCQKCPQKTSFPKSIFIDNSYNNFEKKKKLFTGLDKLTLVTPSEWLAKLVKRSFLKDYTVKVINNGIDLSVFKPSPSNFRKRYNLENKFIILGVANKWEKRKGFEYFIKLSKLIETDEAIVMVGLSKNQLKHLPKNIIGITRTNNIEELAEI
ncbi:MAG: glycosyltransferase, partial [Bacteroidales bacterium]|nr:glycosyltransferase [Bacteroidales bacterium]